VPRNGGTQQYLLQEQSRGLGGDSGYELTGQSKFRRTVERANIKPVDVKNTQPATTPAANTPVAPQSPASRVRAQINQPEQRSEQALLDDISGQPGGLRRMADIGRGNVFQYTDPKTGKTTFSDSAGGAGKWASQPFKTDGPAANALQARYNQDATNRTKTAQAAGLDAVMYPASGPAVGADFRGQQVQLQRDLQQQQPYRQALGLEAMKAQAKIAEKAAGQSPQDPNKDPVQVARKTFFQATDDDPNGIRLAQAESIAGRLQSKGIQINPYQLYGSLAMAINGAYDKDGNYDEMKALDLLSQQLGYDVVPLLSRQ
jgi:hypothetical protein